MQYLGHQPLEKLHFPKAEWSWLRADSDLKVSEDSFLWGFRFGDTTIAWLPQGSKPKTTDTSLPVFLLEPLKETTAESLEIQAFGLYLKTSFTSQKPEEVEWINALCVLEEHFDWDLSKHGLPPYWKETLESCGLEGHPSRLVPRLKYTFLTLEERQFLYSKKWDPAFFELFEMLPEAIRKASLEAFQKYNVSAGFCREISNFILINNKKYGEKAVLEVLKKEHKTQEEFRNSLFRLAQPELARLGDDRIQKLRSLKIPPRTTVFGDPSFEKDILKITHNPRVGSDWEIFKDWVNNPETTLKIAALLDLYQ